MDIIIILFGLKDYFNKTKSFFNKKVWKLSRLLFVILNSLSKLTIKHSNIFITFTNARINTKKTNLPLTQYFPYHSVVASLIARIEKDVNDDVIPVSAGIYS